MQSKVPPASHQGGPGGRPPRVYRGAAYLDENRTLFTLQALTNASDAHDHRDEADGEQLRIIDPRVTPEHVGADCDPDELAWSSSRRSVFAGWVSYPLPCEDAVDACVMR